MRVRMQGAVGFPTWTSYCDFFFPDEWWNEHFGDDFFGPWILFPTR